MSLARYLSKLGGLLNSSGQVPATGLQDAAVTAAKLASGAARANFGAGAVLQVVSVTKTDVFSTASASFIDVTGLTLNITPTSATSKILVVATVSAGNSGGNCLFNLLRNGTNISQSSSAGSINCTATLPVPVAYAIYSVPITFLDSPATTSAVTYKIQMYAAGATAYVNVRANDNAYGATSQITLMEIAA